MNERSYIYGKNHWLLDPDLPVVLNHFWHPSGKILAALEDFGEYAGGPLYALADFIDQHAVPTLLMHSVDGERVDRARISPEHAQALKRLAAMSRPPYEGGSWHHHFALGFLLADPGLYCTQIVTNQTAYAIYKYAPSMSDWLEALLSGERWGATWMTETQGGSDLGANNTVARKTPEGWRLDGEDKYFASNAGIADIALVTARPEGAPDGPKGIALFLVPRERKGGGLNYIVRRFKAKSATRAVPTGEVELHDSEAELVGEAAEGIYYTLETLTVSRLANAIGSMGVARKAHLEALFRAKARAAFGKAIIDHPLLRRDLTDLAVRTAAGTALVFKAVDQFDRAWQASPPYDLPYHYARFLSHLAKNRSADHAAACTQMAMEIFGGLGFLDEYPVARLHREALVMPIWEGTSNIQALDMLEVMQKKGAHEAFLDDLAAGLKPRKEQGARMAQAAIEATLKSLDASDASEAQWYSKDGLAALADAAQVALLYDLAETGGERYAKEAELYATRFLGHEPYPHWALEERAIWSPVPD